MKLCVSLIGLMALATVGCEQKSKAPPTSPAPNTAPEPTATSPVTEPAEPVEPAEPAEPAAQMPAYRHGQFVFFEHWTNAKAAPRARAFYDELMGWELEETEMGGQSFWYIKKDDMPIGIMSTPTDYKGKATWMGYVSVADVDEATEVARGKGATVVAEPMDIPNVGRIAHFKDPHGVYFGLFKGAQGDPPMITEPTEGDMVWMELAAKNKKIKGEAVAFYPEVAGWTVQEMPMGKQTYTVMMANEQVPGGGIDVSDKPKYAGTWIPYVMVDDVDAMFKQARKLKAKPVAPPKDYPTVGRIAIIEDPTGAVIGFITPPAPAEEPEEPAEE